MSGRPLGSIIDSADILAHLAQHASRLVKLQQAFEQGLPEQLTLHSRVANYRSGKIVILAENGAVSMKLKQLAQTIQVNLSLVCPQVTEIEIRVQVENQPTKTSIFRPVRASFGATSERGIAAPAIHQLNDLAQSLPEKSELKASLERLIERSARRGD